MKISEKKNLIIENLEEIIRYDHLTKKIDENCHIKICLSVNPTKNINIKDLVMIHKVKDFLVGGCEVIVILTDMCSTLNSNITSTQMKYRINYCKQSIISMLQFLQAPLDLISFAIESDLCCEKQYVKYMLLGMKNIRSNKIKNATNMHELMNPVFQSLNEIFLNVNVRYATTTDNIVTNNKWGRIIGYPPKIYLLDSINSKFESICVFDSADIVKSKIKHKFNQIKLLLKLFDKIIFPIRKHISISGEYETILNSFNELQNMCNNNKINIGELQKIACHELNIILTCIQTKN